MKKILIVGLFLMASMVGTVCAEVELIPQYDAINKKMDYVPCKIMCFDPVKNKATNGFDPQFLKLPETKQTCQESHADLMKSRMKDLGFCSKSLGTL